MNLKRSLLGLAALLSLTLASSAMAARDCKALTKNFSKDCEKICIETISKKDPKRVTDCPKYCKGQEKTMEKECEKRAK